MPLPGKAVRHLRSLGHNLQPVVQIGKDGVTEGLVAATAQALLDHELIKVRVGGEAPDDRVTSAEDLAKQSGAELVQIIGRTCLLYKRHPKKPVIVLPRGTRPAAPGSSQPSARPAAASAAKSHEADGADEGDEGDDDLEGDEGLDEGDEVDEV